MRRHSLLRMASLLALAGFAAFAAPAQQSPDQQSSDPVADAARKTRAEKQAAAKPKKVYTDDDFASKKNVPATPAASTGGDQASAGATDATAATDASALNDPKSEAYWRKRFRTLFATKSLTLKRNWMSCNANSTRIKCNITVTLRRP